MFQICCLYYITLLCIKTILSGYFRPDLHHSPIYTWFLYNLSSFSQSDCVFRAGIVWVEACLWMWKKTRRCRCGIWWRPTWPASWPSSNTAPSICTSSTPTRARTWSPCWKRYYSAVSVWWGAVWEGAVSVWRVGGGRVKRREGEKREKDREREGGRKGERERGRDGERGGLKEERERRMDR